MGTTAWLKKWKEEVKRPEISRIAEFDKVLDQFKGLSQRLTGYGVRGITKEYLQSILHMGS